MYIRIEVRTSAPSTQYGIYDITIQSGLPKPNPFIIYSQTRNLKCKLQIQSDSHGLTIKYIKYRGGKSRSRLMNIN